MPNSSGVMYTKWQVGTLWLVVSVTLTEGTGNLVDLEQHAEQFIKNLNKTAREGRIDGWSMRADYPYWTGKREQQSQHSIIAKLEPFKCNDQIGSTTRAKTVSAKTCEELLTWNIADGLRTPFDLNITIEAPMISSSQRRKRNVTLNFNNKADIEVKLGRTNHSGYVNRTKKMCAFYSKATFNGYFVYHYKPKGEGKSPYYALPVTRLNDTAKRLYSEKNKLTFMIKGIYEETLCRSLKKNRRRKHNV